MNKKLLAEALGTFTLALAVLTSVSTDSILVTPVIAGLVLGLFVYTIGAKSGSHINPAVTTGLWSLGKIKTNEAVSYIIAQLIGGGLALFVATNFLGEVGLSSAPESFSIFLAELIGMIIFTFGIASVVYSKVNDAASGLVIGGSLLLGIIIAAHLGSSGILNPAVALALGSFNFSYVLGAIFGSAIGMRLYKTLCC